MGRNLASCRAGSLRSCCYFRPAACRGVVILYVLVLAYVLSGCYHKEYTYSLEREYIGLSDCEIVLSLESVDYHVHPSRKTKDSAFIFRILYHCLAADSSQRLLFENVSLLAKGNAVPVELKSLGEKRFQYPQPEGQHVLQYGPFVTGKDMPDSVLVSFDLIVPEGMAEGAPRSGHYDIRAALMVEKIDPYSYMLMWD